MKNPFTATAFPGSYLQKLVESVLLMLAVFLLLNFFFIIVSNIRWLSPLLMPIWYAVFSGPGGTITFSVLLLLGSPLLAFYWHRRIEAGKISAIRSHAVVRGTVRWGLALGAIFFSFMLFIFPLISNTKLLLMDDMPAAAVSGKSFLAYVLLRSLALRWFLSGSLLLGGLFLFFRKTMLAGLLLVTAASLVFLLLWLTMGELSPFHVGYVIAGFVMLVPIYLLKLRWTDLRRRWSEGSVELAPPVVRMSFRWGALMLVLVGIGFTFKGSVKAGFGFASSPLEGKWRVMKLERNGTPVPADAWLTDAEAWSTVYIESDRDLSFCTNPYVFDQRASFYSSYVLDSKSGQISISHLRDRGGPIRFQVEGIGTNELSWMGRVGSDQVKMVMVRGM
jgi:hypothetical protein